MQRINRGKCAKWWRLGKEERRTPGSNHRLTSLMRYSLSYSMRFNRHRRGPLIEAMDVDMHVCIHMQVALIASSRLSFSVFSIGTSR